MDEAQEEELKFLNRRLEKLQAKSEKIEKEKSAIELKLQLLKYFVPDPTDDDIIISFVDAIEKANQYFEFEYFLEGDERIKPDSDKLEIFKLLVKVERVQDQYKKLDFKDIMEAINGRILNLRTVQGRKECLFGWEGYYSKENMRPDSLTLVDADAWPDSNPFLDLAYQIREKAYVMKDNPLDEVNVIKEHHPLFYDVSGRNPGLLWFPEAGWTALESLIR